MTSNCIINHWLLDISSASLIHQESGEQRRLGEYQLKLLVVLIQHAGQILSREELNQLVWERRVIGNNSLPNAIHALRVALEDDGKQQRIIKTVPKKGYILEAEYCQFQRRVTDEEDETWLESGDAALSFNPPPLPVPSVTDSAPAEAPLPQAAPPADTGYLPASNKKRERGMLAFCLMLVVLLAVAAMVWRSAGQQPARFDTVALENASQVRLLRLSNTPRDASTNQLDMVQLIGPALRALNAPLQQQQVTMDVYYSASGTNINLTLYLKSACARHQLAMNIFNGREKPDALRELVRVETERKLHEMATCNP